MCLSRRVARLALGIAIAFAVLVGTFATAGQMRPSSNGSGSAGSQSSSGFASEQAFSNGNDWEPDLAADPGSPYVYMVTTGLDAKACQQCTQPSILLRVSPDSGTTWGVPQFFCAASCRSNNLAGPWQYDPVVRVSNNGTVYVVWLDGWNPSPVLTKSYDHGTTWTLPMPVEQSGQGWADKPWLAVSEGGQDVYVAYNHGAPFVSASHDGGASFARPVKLTPPTDKLFYYPEGGTVAPDGDAYFSMSVETAKGSGPVQLVLFKTSDGGATWTRIPIDGSQQSPPCLASCITDEFQAQIVVEIDAGGTLMVAYTKNDIAGSPELLYSRTSQDGGSTWSGPTLINDAGNNGFPAIVHGPRGGDFRVAWQDDRNGPNEWNTFYSRTTDGGDHWSTPVKLSDLGGGAIYKDAAGYRFPYGDYFGIAADSRGTNFVIWGEGTGRSTFGGSWFTAGN
jgi:hypothetical protein